MKILIKWIGTMVLAFLVTSAFAQQAEMADKMRSEGKIYVVVLIILIVLLGMITYLFLLDKKLNRIEKQLNERKQTKS
jgi:hypothetical protein